MNNVEDDEAATTMTKVEHDYHDHSKVTEAEAHLLAPATGTTDSNADDEANQNLNFPARLHYMLEELEKDGLSHVVSWQPHGRYVTMAGIAVILCVLRTVGAVSSWTSVFPRQSTSHPAFSPTRTFATLSDELAGAS